MVFSWEALNSALLQSAQLTFRHDDKTLMITPRDSDDYRFIYKYSAGDGYFRMVSPGGCSAAGVAMPEQPGGDSPVVLKQTPFFRLLFSPLSGTVTLSATSGSAPVVTVCRDAGHACCTRDFLVTLSPRGGAMLRVYGLADLRLLFSRELRGAKCSRLAALDEECNVIQTDSNAFYNIDC